MSFWKTLGHFFGVVAHDIIKVEPVIDPAINEMLQLSGMTGLLEAKSLLIGTLSDLCDLVKAGEAGKLSVDLATTLGPDLYNKIRALVLMIENHPEAPKSITIPSVAPIPHS
jgi:hypothetical protein